LIDGHVHVWSDNAARFPWRPVYGAVPPTTIGTAEHVLEVLATNGVDVALAVQSRVYGDDHRYLLAAVERFPGRLVGVAALDPTTPDVVTTLHDLVGRGISGLRMDPMGWPGPWLEDGTATPLWHAAAALGIVVEVMIRPAALPALGALATRTPAMPVVVEHMSRYDVDASAPLDALLDLARLPNVSVKVSALASISREPPPHRDVWPLIAAVVEAFGPSRLLWGSDMPWIGADGYKAALATVSALPSLDAAGRRWVLGDTARSIFGLE
jgi:predicted TIM-barrel fold metal-dependent hydrolase